jgi:hypothetical protein
MNTSDELNKHIQDKIMYHEGLRKMHEANEEYEECAKERNEVQRLSNMLKPVTI